MIAVLGVLITVIAAGAALAVALGFDEMKDDKRGKW